MGHIFGLNMGTFVSLKPIIENTDNNKFIILDILDFFVLVLSRLVGIAKASLFNH